MKNPRSCNLLGAFVLATQGQLLQQIVSELSISGQAAAALITIGHNVGKNVDFLSGVLNLSHSGCVRLVDKLAEESLVERRVGEDKRVVSLFLTEAGQQRMRAILRARRKYLFGVLRPLNPKQEKQLTVLLELMLNKMTSSNADADAICKLCEEEVCPQAICPVTLAIPRAVASPS